MILDSRTENNIILLEITIALYEKPRGRFERPINTNVSELALPLLHIPRR